MNLIQSFNLISIGYSHTHDRPTVSAILISMGYSHTVSEDMKATGLIVDIAKISPSANASHYFFQLLVILRPIALLLLIWLNVGFT